MVHRKPIRVLILTRYGKKGASSRVRFYQYLPYLRQHGFVFSVIPLLKDTYLEKLYQGQTRPWVDVLAGYIRRTIDLLKHHHHDILWIEKEVYPWVPALIERMLLPKGVPYVVDYDDAIFHNYDMHPNPWVRRFLGRKIDTVMRHASLVVVCNHYLAKRAFQAGAKRIEILPSVVDTHRYVPENRTPSEVFTIGWVGSPSTSRYLRMIQAALAEICKEGKARVVAVGSGPLDLPGVPLKVIPWDESTEVMEIQGFDVGISPLQNGPWEQGKCGFKLIQYMACGKPVVASPVGINKEIVNHGVNGFLATTIEEWLRALMVLRDNKSVRAAMGKASRATVEKHYSLHIALPRLAKWFASLV